MSVLESLPSRPLTDAEMAALNRADVVDLAVPVDDEGPNDAVLLATEQWVKALVYDDDDGDGWHVLKTIGLEKVDRFDALQSCEAEIRATYDRFSESETAEEA